MNRQVQSVIVGAALLAAAGAPASPRPCRDKDGRIVQCPKERKPTARCKDAKGRFVACPEATDGPVPKH